MCEDVEAQAMVTESREASSKSLEGDLEAQSVKEAKMAALADLTRISKLSVLHQAWGFRFIFFAIPFFFSTPQDLLLC